jgi:hypothetical protein
LYLILLRNLIFVQQSRNWPALVETECSSPYSHEPTKRPHPAQMNPFHSHVSYLFRTL